MWLDAPRRIELHLRRSTLRVELLFATPPAGKNLPFAPQRVADLQAFRSHHVSLEPPVLLSKQRTSRRNWFSTLAGSVLATRAHVAFAQREQSADIVILGSGLGGCSAALAALQNGRRVIMTEPSDWIGGQLTSQGVPPDEHRWIETHGANRSYRELRTRIRDHYRQHTPLTSTARDNPLLNPGNGSVSRLCCEPRIALKVLEDWLEPFVRTGQLTILRHTVPTAADVDSDRIRAVTVSQTNSGQTQVLTGKIFIDATELGDLLPLTGTEFVTGAEARSLTNELHASETANPHNQQAFTVCFAVEHVPGEVQPSDRPSEYEFWRDFVPSLRPDWPGRLLDWTYTHPRTGEPRRLGLNPDGGSVRGVLNLWLYRRIIDHKQFETGQYGGDVSLINWPQNDYLLGNLIGVSADEAREHVQRASQLSLSLLYWLQTEAPRDDGGVGFPSLRLRPDIMGTDDGLAKMPYVRESRRIQAEFTVLEEHVGREQRSLVTGVSASTVRAAEFADSVGVGSYPIDLHPTSQGDNYIDFESLPFQIPLGALIPVRMENLLPACKNIGTTHITSGCYRLHPVEWGIGEAVGSLADFALATGQPPRAIGQQPALLNDFRKILYERGVEFAWEDK